jgi:acyl-CoA thioester hydrolase
MNATFRWPVRIYYEDTDTGGVVYYANYLKFFERARTEWLRSAGISQQLMIEQENVMFVVKSTAIDYHAPAKLDDAVEISLTAEKLGRASVNFSQAAWRIGDAGSELLCFGQIRIGCIDAVSLRPTAIPAIVLQKIKGLITKGPHRISDQ